MKIYTKTGDQGKTSLFGGTRVKKSNLRIDAYGTVDELNSHMGLVRDNVKDKDLISDLIRIQSKLFTLGAMLATPQDKEKLKILNEINLYVEEMEKMYEEALTLKKKLLNYLLVY